MHISITSLGTSIPLATLFAFAVFSLQAPLVGHAESREGFVVGGGFGPGVIHLGEAETSETHFGVSTDLTVGYGLDKNLVAYAMSRIVWFDKDGELTFSESAGLGVSYFFQEQAPALYVTGGLGAAVFVQPDSDSENQFGLAGLAGFGYEAYEHWFAEINVAYGNPGDFDSTSVMAKLNYYFY